MRRALPILVSILILLSACVTEKKRQRICNTCPVVSKSKDSIVIKTVTVAVKVPGAPGPTLYLENPCSLLCDSNGRLKKVNFNFTQNGQNLNINTLGGGLLINTSRKDTTLPAEVPQKEIFSKTERDNIRYIPCENERTAFDGFTRWFFYITGPLWLLFALYIYIRLKRGRPP